MRNYYRCEYASSEVRIPLRENKPLRLITRPDAEQWRKFIADGLKPASIKHHLGNAKGLFGEVHERQLIPSNPMGHFEAGTTPAANDRYITPEETTRVLKHCDDLRLKVQFGLCRLAGECYVSFKNRGDWIRTSDL